MNALYEILLYPDRAENLGQFSAYDVDLGHWKSLSAIFRDTFRGVYERRSSAILLVHGAQGTGKTLFSRRLVQDFERAQALIEPDPHNLWHTLVGDDPPTRTTIATATQGSLLERVEPTSGWLERHRGVARSNKQSRVRIFVIDDAHKDVFLREWAGLSQAEYLGFKERGADSAVLASVAEKLVEDCRGDFQRSIFLLLSNDAARMRTLKEGIDRSHAGLAQVLELPLPTPAIKEQIVRKNTNRLNRVSYWHCLNAAGPEERAAVYDVLKQQGKGFTDSFVAVDSALRSSNSAPRPGRPANRNLITLVTLGSAPSDARAFIDDHELIAEEHHRGAHIGVWWMRNQWASVLAQGNDPEPARKARMVESEFALRWVALDILASHALCRPPSTSDALGPLLVDLITFTPSIGAVDRLQEHKTSCARADADLASGLAAADPAFMEFQRQFTTLGQTRSTVYEPAIRQRLGAYGVGFKLLSVVRPDYVVSDYTPCALTDASDRDKLADVMRRSCHAVEFTAFIQADMRGLKEYILKKIERYALLLESV